MSEHKFTYRVEMSIGQDMREVDADSYMLLDGWIVFSRKPPQGGSAEYWRVKDEHVVSIETKVGGRA